MRDRSVSLARAEPAALRCTEMDFDRGSRSLLSPYDLPRFPDDTLFHRIARALCEADCLPRKELYESWEVARRVRRRFRGGRVVDLACGHGLTAAIMMILDGASERGLAVDRRLPESAHKVLAALRRVWPRLANLTLCADELGSCLLTSADVVVSIHACGALSDEVLARAIAARARVAILPCCHDLQTGDAGGLTGWLDPALAIDVMRAERLRRAGYKVHTQLIPAAITPKNRLLIAAPAEGRDFVHTP